MSGGHRARLAPGLVVLLVGLGYFASYMAYGFAYDEGYLLDSVERIMDGQVIYRDFHHTYAPGSFYLVAALFKVLGHNILVERAVFAALEALKCLLGFLIVRTVCRCRFAYLAPILMMIAPGPWHKVFFPAFGFLALYAVLAAVRDSRWFVASGAVVGLAALFRQDVAGFALVAVLAGLLIENLRLGRGVAPAARGLALVAVGAAAVVGPVVAYFAGQHALGPMIHKITVDGMLDNMTNRIPFPGLAARTGVDGGYIAYVLPMKALFYLPFMAYAGAAALIGKALVRRTWSAGTTSLVLVLAASVLAFNQSAWRSDVGHLLQTMQYAFLLLPIVVWRLCGSVARGLGLAAGGRRALDVAVSVAACAAVFWATFAGLRSTSDAALAQRFRGEGLSVGDSEYLGSALVRAGNTARMDVPRARLHVTPAEADFFLELRRFLETNTGPGEYVLAVPQLQTVYFLFDRRNPTRYAHYRRRLDPAEERRYIEDISARGTRYILLTEPYQGARIGETSESFSEYAKPVRDWILANYSAVGRLGWIVILEKKP
ncbi:MAG: hypothetical protein WAW06_09690 [bacterium]